MRAAMPNTVKNPTSDPMERIPPVANAASTPPTSASGRVTKASSAGRQLPSATCSSRKMIASAMTPVVNSRCLRPPAAPRTHRAAPRGSRGGSRALELVLQLLPHRADVDPLDVGEDVQVP